MNVMLIRAIHGIHAVCALGRMDAALAVKKVVTGSAAYMAMGVRQPKLVNRSSCAFRAGEEGQEGHEEYRLSITPRT